MQPLTIEGTVIHGNHLGNTIGMPTANIIIPSKTDIPQYGVYYSSVCVDGTVYKGITNVGSKPTVQDNGNVNAETYLYDFSGNLYGKKITVTLLEFRRPEMRFNSFEELSEKMHEDLEAGRQFNK